MDIASALVVGQLVYSYGFEYRVVEVQPSRIAPDGRVTHYYRGEATKSDRNRTLPAGFRTANLSHR